MNKILTPISVLFLLLFVSTIFIDDMFKLSKPSAIPLMMVFIVYLLNRIQVLEKLLVKEEKEKVPKKKSKNSTQLQTKRL